MARPAPGRLYDADDLQAAYESGYGQMYDHDSFVFLDRLNAIVDRHQRSENPDEDGGRCERLPEFSTHGICGLTCHA